MTRRVLLVGAGHAHALVLLDWARRRPAGAELVVVSPDPRAPYSGMVPGWLAGRYRDDEIEVDFARLAAAAGARWVAGSLHALDAERRAVHLADGASIGYDLLSLNVGSTLEPPVCGDAPVLPMRPLSGLRQAWGEVRRRWPDTSGPARITAVGAGAAGFESLLAVIARLRALAPQRRIEARLVAHSATLLPGLAPAAARLAARRLAQADVVVELGRRFDGEAASADDLVLWATGAEAQRWQRDPARRCGLAVDDGGFVRIGPTLASTSHPEVFAVGDGAAWATPLPKSGVYAVRMGPVLAHNLRAALGDGPPRAYVPQRRSLVLLATADDRAIAARGSFAAEGRWAWRWKDRIDRAFVRRFAP